MSTASATSDARPDQPARLTGRDHFTRPGRYWLLAAAVLWLAGVSKGMNVITLMSYLMLVVWGLNLCVAGRRFGNLYVRTLRTLPAAVFAGESFPIEIEVANRGNRTIEGVQIELNGASCFVDLQPGNATFQASATPKERGWYYLDPVQVRSGFPFGLVERRARGADIDGILVFPALGELDYERLLHALPPSAGQEGLRPRRVSGRDDFHGLRDYRPGDSLRSVHWRSSARRGNLLVKEFDDRSARDLVLVLDPFVPGSGKTAGELARGELDCEQAVSLAATLCYHWCQHGGSRLVLAIGGAGGPLIVAAEAEPGQATLFLEALALAPGSDQVDIDPLIEQLADQLPRAPVLLVSSRPQGLAEELSRRLGREVLHCHAGDGLAADCYRPPHLFEEDRA
ncbi:MAG: DUF58 domain-containing protein [Gemmataceae bacterium]